MTRTDGDNLLANLCLMPTDRTARDALIDWLTEAGDEFLANALKQPDAEQVVRRALELSLRLEQKVCLRHLFTAAVQMGEAKRLLKQIEESQGRLEPVVLPPVESPDDMYPWITPTSPVPPSPWRQTPRRSGFWYTSKDSGSTDGGHS